MSGKSNLIYGRILITIIHLLSCVFLLTNPVFAQSGINYLGNEYFDVVPVAKTLEDDLLQTGEILPSDYFGLLKRGIQHYEHNDFKAALKDINSSIASYSKYGLAYYYRGVVRKAIGRNRLAEADYLKALEHDPLLIESHYELGLLYADEGKYRSAENHFNIAATAQPESPIPQYYLGILYEYREDEVKSKMFHSEAVKKDPEFIPSIIQLARIDLFANKLGKANKKLEQVLQLDSLNEQAWFLRGVLYLEKNDLERGLAQWDRLLELRPDEQYYYRLIGFLKIDLGLYDEAVQHFIKSIAYEQVDLNKYDGKTSPMSMVVDLHYALKYIQENSWQIDSVTLHYLNKGMCAFVTRNYPAANANFQMAIREDPNLSTGYFLMALTQEYMGNKRRAMQYYEYALDKDSLIYDAYKKRGILRFEFGDHNKALEDFDAMLEMDASGYLAQQYRGNIMMLLEDYNSAIIAYSSYIDSDSSNQLVYANRGFCLEKVGNVGLALEDYLMALEFNDDPQEELNLNLKIAQLYLATKDTARAISLLEKIINQNKEYRGAYNILGEIYFAREEFLSAMVQFNLAMSGGKLFLPALLNRAKLYLMLQKYKLAIADFNKYIFYASDDAEALYFRGIAKKRSGMDYEIMNDTDRSIKLGADKNDLLKNPINYLVLNEPD